MRLAQMGQLTGAFFGGGLGGAFLDHLWTNKNARKAELRSIDRDRINLVRERSRLVYGGQMGEGLRSAYKPAAAPEGNRPLFGWDEHAPVAVQELADERLTKLWKEFQMKAAVFPLKYREVDDDEKQRLFFELDDAHEELLRRLNELERRR